MSSICYNQTGLSNNRADLGISHEHIRGVTVKHENANLSSTLNLRAPLASKFPPIKRDELVALQINLGYLCNQACSHCHVDAGPNRTEMMNEETANLVIDFAVSRGLQYVDLTGGAPELNPYFRMIVERLTSERVKVIDRCNLTVLEEPGQENLADFLAKNNVKVVASMPCHGEQLVDLQRGKGVFEKSIRGLQTLNRFGYGSVGGALELDLVHNPTGPSLPPPQSQLELDYKRELKANYDIEFNHLLTIANMPIARFRHSLLRDGEYEAYMQTLIDSFQASNLSKLMCKSLISVDWRGYVYDCDFNQMLAMPFSGASARVHLSELMSESFNGKEIAYAEHCFGCTAGQGSSCGGALVDEGK